MQAVKYVGVNNPKGREARFFYRNFTVVEIGLTARWGTIKCVGAYDPSFEGEYPVTSQGDTAQRDWFEYLAQHGTSISRELYRLLKSRRCEPRESPFRGFQSPPDRF